MNLRRPWDTQYPTSFAKPSDSSIDDHLMEKHVEKHGIIFIDIILTYIEICGSICRQVDECGLFVVVVEFMLLP